MWTLTTAGKALFERFIPFLEGIPIIIRDEFSVLLSALMRLDFLIWVLHVP
jgi:hypothetical protein